MTVDSVTRRRRAGDVRLRPADLSGRPERAGRPGSAGARGVERQPGQRDEPEPAGLFTAGQRRTTQNGTQCPANKLVITPSAPIADGQTIIVTDQLHRPAGRPHRRRRLDRGLVPGRTRRPRRTTAASSRPSRSATWPGCRSTTTRPPSRPTTSTTPSRSARPGSAGRTRRRDPGATLGHRAHAGQPAGRQLPRRLVAWHWHSPEPIASYLSTNSIGSYDL